MSKAVCIPRPIETEGDGDAIDSSPSAQLVGSLKDLYPDMPRLWLPDSASNNCMGCGTPFGWLVRRHHCRLCGRLFCDTCANHSRRAPKMLSSRQSYWKRLCTKCTDRVDRAYVIQDIVEQFECNAFLTVVDWYGLAATSKRHRQGVGMLVSRWRRICTASGTPTEGQRTMLWANRYLLYGHPSWYPALAAAGIDVCSGAARASCRILTCNDCGNFVHVLRILDAPVQLTLRATALHALRTAPADIVLVHAEAILDAAAPDVIASLLGRGDVTVELFWRMRARKMDVTALHVPAIVESLTFANEFERGMRGDSAVTFSTLPCLLPGTRHTTVLQVRMEQRTTRQSASNPSVVPVLMRRDGRTFMGHLLYKPGGSCRKDRVALDVIALMAARLKDDYSGTRFAVHYDVAQLEHGALIAMVEDTVTLYAVRKSGMTLLNYIMENNRDTVFHTIRTRFIHSCAFASVVTLLLGVGDRHLENILINDYGTLFHIDFDYLCGENPWHMQGVMGSGTKLRITNGMLDAMGGWRSAGVQLFRRLIADMMRVGRTQSGGIKRILHSLVRSGDIGATTLHEHMDATFFCSSFEDISVVVDSEVHHASRRTIYGLLDWIHELRKSFP